MGGPGPPMSWRHPGVLVGRCGGAGSEKFDDRHSGAPCSRRGGSRLSSSGVATVSVGLGLCSCASKCMPRVLVLCLYRSRGNRDRGCGRWCRRVLACVAVITSVGVR